VVRKNVKLYGIPFTTMLNLPTALSRNFTILCLANVEAEVFGIFILAYFGVRFFLRY